MQTNTYIFDYDSSTKQITQLRLLDNGKGHNTSHDLSILRNRLSVFFGIQRSQVKKILLHEYNPNSPTPKKTEVSYQKATLKMEEPQQNQIRRVPQHSNILISNELYHMIMQTDYNIKSNLDKKDDPSTWNMNLNGQGIGE